MFHWTIHLEEEHRIDQPAVVVGHEIYCFEGDINQRRRDHIEVHVFNTVSLCWRKLIPETPGTGEPHLEVPSRCWGNTAVLIAYTVYLWGGWTNLSYCNVLYAFDVDTHTWFKPQVSGTVPEGRRFHSACVLGKVMFIYGGWNQTGTTNDIYKLDTTTMVWTLINTRGTAPPVSWGHSATIIGTKMFVFGGCGMGQFYNTIRVFDTETNHWMESNTPPTQIVPGGRCAHSSFTYNGELYIFGGCYQYIPNMCLNDMWKLSPETFSWKEVASKGKHPHGMKKMYCYMVGDHVVLFRPGELYVLDFSPSLKTLCKKAVIQYSLDQSELPHNIRWELEVMTSNRS